jgi:cobalt-zinc-cadmium efflux system membrane fusion protein
VSGGNPVATFERFVLLTEYTNIVVPLPSAVSLDRAKQIRIVAYVALGFAAVLAIIVGLQALLTARPPAASRLPPGAFKATPEQLRQLAISPVRVGANADLVRATGSISVDGDHSTPILLPYSGQVTDVMVAAGEPVSKGQPLLRIASPDIVDARNALAAASAQQTSATEAMHLAQANATRQKAIYETAGGALKEYTQAKSDLVSAQSSLRTAQSATQTARDRLAIFGKEAGHATVNGAPTFVYRSPVSGLIAERNVAPGQFVSTGGATPVMTITDPSHVWLIAQLPESEVANVRVGDRVTVTTPALPGRHFDAIIDNVGAALDPVSHRLPVRATISNPDNALKPQMFASFVIRRQLGGEGVLVPASAVIHEGDSARVWVLGRDGLLYGWPVRTDTTEGGLTRISAGLKPGDRVVTSGALFVNEASLEQ